MLFTLFTLFSMFYKSIFQGIKRPRDHIGDKTKYAWNKEKCIETVSSYPDDHEMNYSDLARQFELKNVKGYFTFNSSSSVGHI